MIFVSLDPFLGTGTTQAAAAAACRNSIGIEKDAALFSVIGNGLKQIVEFANRYHEHRLGRHRVFVQSQIDANKPLKHRNRYYDFPVMTSQETDLYFHHLKNSIELDDDRIAVNYTGKPGR